MRYYLIAGEASGDLYGSLLISAIKLIDSNASYRFWGGPRMSDVSDGKFHDIRNSSYMGFKDVFFNIKKLSSLFGATKRDIKNFDPDLIIFIDYPGFNLRMAKWTKKMGYKNAYFICPKIWAWKKNRYQAIKKYIDQMICVLPFEIPFLKDLGIDGKYYGHPLVSQIEPYHWSKTHNGEIAVLPGSRKSELKYILPVIDQLVKHNRNRNFRISIMNSIKKEYYEKYLDFKSPNLEISENNYTLMRDSQLALVTSGTATLEAALIGVPQVVIYKADVFSYWIANKLVKLDYVSLPNLILNKGIITELIQDNLSLENLSQEVERLSEGSTLEQLLDDYKRLKQLLKDDGNTINRITQSIVNLAKP